MSQPGGTYGGNFYTPDNHNFYHNFRYTDLGYEICNIRLLRIYPPDSDDVDATKSPIVCDLLDCVTLSAVKGKYITVYYFAGDPKNIERITVNGMPFNVFSNLGHALRQARHFWRDRFDEQELLLWADQVCINQYDYLERSQQVKFMGDIYAAAEQVLISLSTERCIGGGIEWLHQLSLDPNDYEPLAEDEDHYEPRHGVFEDMWDDESFHLGWNAFIQTCLTSSWWSRAWVRQEFLCSPQVHFIAAFQSIHWKALADIIGIYRNAVYDLEMPAPAFLSSSSRSTEHLNSCQACALGNDSSEFWQAGKRADRLLATKSHIDRRQGGLPNLLDNLSDSHLCEASDARDLVYAFLAFSSNIYGVNPDYSPGISLQDILHQLACNVVSQDGNLDILRLAYLMHGKHLNPDLPSWAPNWCNTALWSDGHSEKLPDSYKTTFISFQRDNRGREGRVLQVRGFLWQVLDTIATDRLRQRRQYISDTGEIIPTEGYTEEGDEAWMLHGARNLLILRPQDYGYQLVGEILDTDGVIPETYLLVEEVKRLGEKDDAALTHINIV